MRDFLGAWDAELQHPSTYSSSPTTRIVPLVTFAHGEEDVDRLVRALRDLVDERAEPGAETAVEPLPSRRELRTEQRMLPRDAFFARPRPSRPTMRSAG